MRRGRRARPETEALDRFTRTAETAATGVIRSYSTSFGLATRLLGSRHRQHVRNIYAMVRIADEIVDGVAAEAGLEDSVQAEALDAYETETRTAMSRGYSTDMILHAFGRTARRVGIDESLTGPFFDSMRADALGGAFVSFDAAQHERYVHGSAEVVGLMCLRVFLCDDEPRADELAVLEHGARQLGAAFQNVNFLRDIADDTSRLRRGYLGGNSRVTDADRDRWVETVRRQLDDASKAVPLLPRDCRAAVRSAHGLFLALTERVARTPAEELYRTRVRVPDPVKLATAARALAVTAREPRS